MTFIKRNDEGYAVLEDSARNIFELPITEMSSDRVKIPKNFLQLSKSGLAIAYGHKGFEGKVKRQWLPLSQLEIHLSGGFMSVSVPRWLDRKIVYK